MRIQRALGSLSTAEVASPVSPEAADVLRERLERQLMSLRNVRRTDKVFTAVLAFFLAVDLIGWNRHGYINSADAHYHHVLRIALPYLAAGEQAQIESDFAQIRTRQDYVNVLSKLEGKCRAQGRTAPQFDPW